MTKNGIRDFTEGYILGLSSGGGGTETISPEIMAYKTGVSVGTLVKGDYTFDARVLNPDYYYTYSVGSTESTGKVNAVGVFKGGELLWIYAPYWGSNNIHSISYYNTTAYDVHANYECYDFVYGSCTITVNSGYVSTSSVSYACKMHITEYDTSGNIIYDGVEDKYMTTGFYSGQIAPGSIYNSGIIMAAKMTAHEYAIERTALLAL